MPISPILPRFLSLAFLLFAATTGVPSALAQKSEAARPAIDRRGLAFGDYEIYDHLDVTAPLSAVALGSQVLSLWTDVTTPALADTVFTRDKKGVAFVDYDSDGDVDLCAVGEGEHGIALFRNDGGSYTEVTSGPLLFPASGSSQTWGDFDNDGDPDLAFFTEEDRPYVFRNDGAGAFTDVTPLPLLTPAHGHSSAWADADHDGDLDLYVANMGRIATTGSRLFRNGGNGGSGEFVDATVDSLGVRAGDGMAWGDYDNDGDQDLFLARFLNTQDLLLRNDLGAFVNVTGSSMIDALNGHSSASADFDNDLDLDIFVANANGPNRLYRNDGDGTFSRATPAALVLGIHSVGMAWGDYDNDGRQDLFVTVTDNGQSRMFHNDGGGEFSEVPAGPLTGTGTAAGAAVADYDEDGDLDLYVSSYLRRPNQLFRNDLANGNHWLQVDLEGTTANRGAVGARVYVEAGGQWQMRELTTCTGYRSQSAMTAHFGLGAATQADRIIVRWPSGVEQVTTPVVANQRLRLVESGSAAVVPTAGPRSPLSLTVAPNPFAAFARLSYVLPSRGNVRLEILDLAGRVMRSLENGSEQVAGRYERTWDGQDDAGRRVREGVYFLRLTTSMGSAQRRIVALASF